MRTDVLIVGGGPTGLTAAILLKLCGINCRIIDKETDQARESRALGIQARTLEFFQNLGIVDRFLQQGQIASGVRAYQKGKEVLTLNFSDMGRKDTPFPFVYFLSQEKTEKILNQYLQELSIEVERQTTLIDFKQNELGVQAIISGASGTREIISARYLIGCDGGHSTVRQLLNLPFEGGSYPSQFIMSDAKVEWELGHDEVHVFFNPDSIGVFFPLQGKELSRVLTVREIDKEFEPNTKTTTSFPASLLEIEKNFIEASQQDLRLTHPTWVTKFHVHNRCVNHFRVNHVFLAGDAAHVHSPMGAQGMNTGIQDAANLCWKLARVLKGFSDEKLLDTYHSERWPIAQKLLQVTDRAFSLATSQNRFILKTRELLFPLITKFLMQRKSGRQTIFGFISQLGIRYHKSLAIAPAAGMRIPNFSIPQGKKVFELLTGYQYHLLVCGEEEKINDSFPEVIIHHIGPSSFQQKGMILVRPDGYIALRTNDCSQKSLGRVNSLLHQRKPLKKKFHLLKQT